MNNLESRIAAHPFIRPLGEQARKVLAQGAREEVFEANQLIIRPGHPANSMYLVDSGRVAIEAPEGGRAASCKSSVVDRYSGGRGCTRRSRGGSRFGQWSRHA